MRIALPLPFFLVSLASASTFSGSSTENDAVELAKTVDLKQLSSADLTFLIKEKRWLAAAQQVLLRAKETPIDFAAPVRSAVSGVRKELDDLIRALDKNYGEASQVSPAFQWAQNSSHIFLQVKFAQRWNAPGVLEVENTTVTISDCCFSFKGFGEHSMIRKEYKLFLQFLDPVLEPPASSWHMMSAGRLAVTIVKKKPRAWERLLRSENVKPDNMGIWIDMRDKWKSELASQEDAKLKAARKLSEDDDDEEEEANNCPDGSFADSKVVEFCPEHFLSRKTNKNALWSVLYYLPEGTTKKSVSPIWRALADLAPSHNKNAALASVDCLKHKAFCEKMGMNDKVLPKAMRYAPADTTEASVAAAVSFASEFVLEDLAAWASASKEEEQKDEKKSKKKKKKSSKKEL